MLDHAYLYLVLFLGLGVGLLLDRYIFSKKRPIVTILYGPILLISVLISSFFAIQASLGDSSLLILLALLIPTLGFFLSSKILTSRLAHPLQSLLESVEKKDSKIQIDYYHSDELSNLIDALTKARDKRKETEDEWQKGNSQLVANIEEIASRTKEINESITYQNSNVTETTFTSICFIDSATTSPVS
jgi:methyl-accepting chemotaxis protein